MKINKPEPKSNSLLKKALKYLILSILAVIAITLLLSALAISLLLGSQSTREWFIQDITPNILSSSSFQLKIQGFNSPNFGFWYFESISLSMSDQALFSAKKLFLNLDTASLLDKKIDVYELSADNLLIVIPEENNTDKTITNKKSESNWRSMILPFRLQNLALRHVEILGTQLENPAFQLDGRLDLLWQDKLFTSDLILKSKVQPEAHINLQASMDKEFSGALTANIKKAPGGWIGKTIKLPKEQSVDFNIELSARADDAYINWELHSFKMPWQKHKLKAKAQGRWEKEFNKLDLAQLSIFIDEKEQHINGWWQDQLVDLNIRLNGFPIELTETLQDYILGGQVTGSAKVRGNISNPSFQTNLKANTKYRNQKVTLDIKGEGDTKAFNIEKGLVSLGDAKASASGSVLIEKQELDLKIHQLSGPVRVIETFDVEFPANLHININEAQGFLKGPFISPAYSGFTSAKGKYKEQTFDFQSEFQGGIEKVNLDNFAANISAATLQADGLIDWQNEQFNLTLDSSKLPLNLVSLLDIELPADLSANINADGRLRGNFTNPYYKGEISSKGSFKTIPFTSSLTVDGDLKTLRLSELTANLGDAQVQAWGDIKLEQQLLNIHIKELIGSSTLAQNFDIELPNDLAVELKIIEGKVSGPFNQPSYKGFASASGLFKQQALDIQSQFKGDLEKIELTNFITNISDGNVHASGLLNWHQDIVDLKLKLMALPYQTIKLAGIEPPKNLSGTINADLIISGKLPIPIIDGKITSEGELEGEPFSFNIEGSQKDLNLFFDQTQLIWHDTILSANGLVSKDNLDLHIKLQDLKLTDLNKFGYDLKPGNLDFNFDLLGSIESPKLDGLVTLTVNKQYNPDDINEPLQDIVVTTNFSTENDILMINSEVSHGHVAKGNLQINSTFKPFLNWLADESNTLLIKDLPLNIKAKGDIGLNWINNFIDRDIQNISGNLSLDTQLTGSLNKPHVDGSLKLLNGIYINALSQTTIENTEVQLAFDEKSITIIKAKATDGHKGTLNADGNITLADDDNGLIDITLNLNNASLVRREDIEGDATGTLQLSGDFKKLLVKGDIDISPFQIMLDLIPTDAIPEIDVSFKEDSNKPRKNKINAPPIALDIKVGVEQQAYIRGRGLDAELKGKLTLTGTSNKPNYNGQFNVVRGTFELFAKTFKLEEGDVLFSNDAVSLFVQGRHKGKDITFIASLSGTLDDLKIGLRTEPTLPEDEALARLLFGRTVRNITPIQAIQLASAIQTLRGEGGGFDPLGKARKLFHVDNISVESQETSEGNGVAVGLGKYITESVYVELERTPDPSQPWKGSVEVELTPNINLETTSGGNSGFGGVELQWKNDY